MKELNTFLQICIYLAISLTIFTLCINFVSMLGVFGTGIETGVGVGSDTPSIFTDISGFSGGVEGIWLIVTTVTGILAVGVAILMHSAIPVGAYILSVVFWTSYSRCISVINVPTEAGATLFAAEPMSYFLIIATVGMLFIWIAAIVGIFTGSG